MKDMNIFGILAGPLGWAMRMIYNLVQSYGWTIIIFTVLVRILMIPLSLKQQKDQAKSMAYQPMIQEIQKKWKNDKNRQQQETMKFYEENGVKMTPGCMPMLANMLVLFGIIAVIQAPLQYMLQMPQAQIDNAVAVVQYYDPELDLGKNAYTKESVLIGEILKNKEDTSMFTDGVEVTDKDGNTSLVKVEQEWVDKVANFKFDFMGLNLSQSPSMELSVYLILPILSVLTMFGSQLIMMRGMGQSQQNKTMWITTIVMGVFFGWYAFTIPVGFSLYYTVSNIVTTIQQMIVRKIHNPEKIREQIELEVEERRKAKKAKKQVVIKSEDGEATVKEVSETELARLRLARARELDAERYGEDKAEKPVPVKDKKEQPADEPPPEQTAEKATEAEPADTPQETQPAAETPEKQEAYKPGRRKRARQNKEKTEETFADKEKAAEDVVAEKGEG